MSKCVLMWSDNNRDLPCLKAMEINKSIFNCNCTGECSFYYYERNNNKKFYHYQNTLDNNFLKSIQGIFPYINEMNEINVIECKKNLPELKFSAIYY